MKFSSPAVVYRRRAPTCYSLGKLLNEYVCLSTTTFTELVAYFHEICLKWIIITGSITLLNGLFNFFFLSYNIFVSQHQLCRPLAPISYISSRLNLSYQSPFFFIAVLNDPTNNQNYPVGLL